MLSFTLVVGLLAAFVIGRITSSADRNLALLLSNPNLLSASVTGEPVAVGSEVEGLVLELNKKSPYYQEMIDSGLLDSTVVLSPGSPGIYVKALAFIITSKPQNLYETYSSPGVLDTAFGLTNLGNRLIVRLYLSPQTVNNRTSEDLGYIISVRVLQITGYWRDHKTLSRQGQVVLHRDQAKVRENIEQAVAQNGTEILPLSVKKL